MLNYLDLKLVKWNRRLRGERIYILPTRVGLYFSAVVLILFVISFSYGHSLAYSTAFLLVSVIVISLPYTNYNLSQLELKIGPYDDLSAGESKEIELRLSSQSRFFRHDVEVELIFSNRNSPQIVQASELLFLEPFGRTAFKVGLAELEMGHYQEVVARLKSSFPFGLFFAWRYFYLPIDLWVYPRRQEKTSALMLTPLAMDEKRARENVSDSSAHHPMSEHDDFSGHGPFLPGHSFGSIDWKIYARTGSLYIKEFEGRAHELLQIEVKRGGDALVRAGEITSIVYDLVKDNRRFKLHAPDFDLQTGPGSGAHFAKGILRQLVMKLTADRGRGRGEGE